MAKTQNKPKVTVYTHKNVNPNDGTFTNGELGAIHPDGRISISHPKGGCGMNGCNCSPGHWVQAGLPVDEHGIVRGMVIHFKSRNELMKYLVGYEV